MRNALLTLTPMLCVLSIACTSLDGTEAPWPPPHPPTENGAEAPFAFTQLAEDVIVVTTEPYAANSLLVRTEERTIILVDTPMIPADTAVLVDWIEERWESRLRHAISSHWHADASAGNRVLIGRGVEVISSRRTAAAIETRGVSARESLVQHFKTRDRRIARQLRGWIPTPANRVVEVNDTVDLTLEDEPVRLVYPGPSHSDDSIGIFFPERSILYGGCAVRSDGRIVNRNEADAENWPRALEVFAALEPAIVVPGHGKRFDAAMIEESIAAAEKLATEE